MAVFEESSGSGAVVALEPGLLAEGSARQMLDLLTPVLGVVPKHAVLAVIQRALVCRAGWDVTVTSTDLDIEATHVARLGANGGAAAAAIDVQSIVKILKGLERNDYVRLLSDGQWTHLTRGTTKYRFPAYPAEDFPLMRRSDVNRAGQEAHASIGAKELLLALSSISSAMGVQDIREYLCGARMVLARGSATFVGSNGFWLAKCGVESSHDRCCDGTAAVLPRKAVLESIRALKSYAGPVRIAVEGSPARVKMSFGSMTLKTKTLAGRYPSHELILAPRDGAFESVELPCADMLSEPAPVV